MPSRGFLISDGLSAELGRRKILVPSSGVVCRHLLPVFPWNYPGKSKLMHCIIVGDFVHELRHNWLGLFRSPLFSTISITTGGLVLSCLFTLHPAVMSFEILHWWTCIRLWIILSLCPLSASSAHLSVFLPACLPASQPTCLPAAFALCTCLGELDAACLSGLCAGRRQNSKQQPQPGPAAGRMAPRRRLTARIAR